MRKFILNMPLPCYSPEGEGTGENETETENSNEQDVAEWKAEIAKLTQTISELSSRLESAEGRPDHSQALETLTTELAATKAELAELKANKPEPETEKKSKPKPQSSRKASLVEKHREKSEADPQGPELQNREPRRKLRMI